GASASATPRTSRSIGAARSIRRRRRISRGCGRPGIRCARPRRSDPMPMIRETIVTTVSEAGAGHIPPFGIIADGEEWIIAPFHPSATIDNLRAVPFAVANYTDDVRIFAGCLTGRREWPTIASDNVPVPRLAAALAHDELAVARVTEDAQRPRF